MGTWLAKGRGTVWQRVPVGGWLRTCRPDPGHQVGLTLILSLNINHAVDQSMRGAMNPSDKQAAPISAIQSSLSASAPLCPPPAVDRAPPAIVWENVASGGRLVIVHYKDQVYQLRETRNGKLILTK